MFGRRVRCFDPGRQCQCALPQDGDSSLPFPQASPLVSHIPRMSWTMPGVFTMEEVLIGASRLHLVRDPPPSIRKQVRYISSTAFGTLRRYRSGY